MSSLVLLLCLASPRGLAASELSVRPLLGGGFGHTTYDLRVDGPDYSVLSRLAFPLDTLLLGGELSFGLQRWDLTFGVLTSLLHPWRPMADSDWFENSGYPPWLWSYTESPVEMRSLFVRADAAVSVAALDSLGILGVFGFRFQYIRQLAVGLVGWQAIAGTDPGLDVRIRPIPYEDVDCLDYTVVYAMPSAGFRVRVPVLPGLEAELDAGALLVTAWDRDDHLLRGKLSTALGLGFGLEAGLRLRVRTGPGALAPRLVLEGGLLGLWVRTTQTQEWYADVDGEPPAGTVYGGIGHRMTSLQGRLVLGLQFGL